MGKTPAISDHGCNIDSCFNNLLASININENTAASYVRTELDVASMLNKPEETNLMFDNCESHSLCGVVNGVHLQMKGLGNMVEGLHVAIDDKFGRLLFGSNLPLSFLSRLHLLSDDLTNKIPGFSFLSNSEDKNWVREQFLWAIAKTFDSGGGKAELLASETDIEKDEILPFFGKQLRARGVDKWLQLAQSELQDLLVCVHLTAVSPPRATEIAALHICSTT